MYSTLPIFLGILTIGLVLACALLAWRDQRRMTRADEAARQAVEDHHMQMEAAQARGVMRFKLMTVKHRDAYRCLLWDAQPVSDSQVEGHLVPYYIAEGRSRSDAERDMHDFIERWVLRVTMAHGVADFKVVETEYIDQTDGN